MIKDLSSPERGGAVKVLQGIPYAGLSIKNTPLSCLEGAIIREQVDDVIPHLAIQIIAIDVLKVAHHGFVFHFTDTIFKVHYTRVYCN